MAPAPQPMPLGPAPIPSAAPPYMARSAPRAGRPLEPWKDSLRIQMFIWGGALLLAFLTPLTLEPGLTFSWDTIIDAPGKAKIAPLILVAAGLLSLVMAIIPSSPPPRGLLAGLVGLTGLLTPTLIGFTDGEIGLPSILKLVGFIGMLVLIPGLLIRNEYRESSFPRILVTIGVLCVLAGYLIPQNGSLPLVAGFERIIDAPGEEKVVAIIALLPLVYAVVSLLVWLPSPSSGLGAVMAWAWITLAALAWLVSVVLNLDKLVDALKVSPNATLLAWVPATAYLALLGYGFATVIGKKLE
jgi:hypothetical protein